MKPSVIREMTTDEIRDRVSEEVDALDKMNIAHAVSPVENPMQMRQMRKSIARLKTELQKREYEAAGEQQSNNQQ